MAKSVTMQQFASWVEANVHRTWFRGQSFRNASLEIKYFYPSLDTRDMKIFHITTDKDHIFGNHGDVHDTVLSALEARLNGEQVENELGLGARGVIEKAPA